MEKLQELEYVNLAVNNVTVIEGLECCESLLKVDLTLNFVPIENYKQSIECLMECPDFNELYLTGNPCTDWKEYKDYAVAKLKNLKRIDGDDISKSWKIQAAQRLPLLEEELAIKSQESIREKEGKPFDPEAYTPESRWEIHNDELKRKKEHEEESKKNSMFAHLDEFKTKPREGPPSIYNKQGKIL